jgi:hypothetical protein
MAKRKSRSPSARKVPKVRIVRYPDRPFQLRYDCPVQKRQIPFGSVVRLDRRRDPLAAAGVVFSASKTMRF